MLSSRYQQNTITSIGYIVSFTLLLLLFNSCMTWPYYKIMPYLPAVKGYVVEKEDNLKIENVIVYWKNKQNNIENPTYTNSDGYFEFKVIEKYITWKIVMMEPGWGGTLIFKKKGYKTMEYDVGGLYNPSHVFEISVKMEKE